MAAERSGLYFMFLAPPPPTPLSEVSASAKLYKNMAIFDNDD